MARPQWGASLEKVEERSLEIIIALDTSKSMLASDFKPTACSKLNGVFGI